MMGPTCISCTTNRPLAPHPLPCALPLLTRTPARTLPHAPRPNGALLLAVMPVIGLGEVWDLKAHPGRGGDGDGLGGGGGGLRVARSLSCAAADFLDAQLVVVPSPHVVQVRV